MVCVVVCFVFMAPVPVPGGGLGGRIGKPASCLVQNHGQQPCGRLIRGGEEVLYLSSYVVMTVGSFWVVLVFPTAEFATADESLRAVKLLTVMYRDLHIMCIDVQ